MLDKGCSDANDGDVLQELGDSHMLSSVPCIDKLHPDKVCLCNEWGSDDYSFVRREGMV